MPDFPYPTHIEILRTISKVCGVNAANKKLDDIAYSKTLDYRLFNEHKAEFYKKIGKALGLSYKAIIEDCIDNFFDEYTAIVANVHAGGVTRNQMIRALTENLFDRYAKGLIVKSLGSLQGSTPQPSLFFSSNGTCSANICEWLFGNEDGWVAFYHSLNKEDKAKIKAWSVGEHIPHIQSISLIDKWQNNPEIKVDWRKVKFLLWVASVIDRAKKDFNAEFLIEHCRKTIWGSTNVTSLEEHISRAQKKYWQNYGAILPVVDFLQKNLTRTIPKDKRLEIRFQEELNDYRSFFFFTKDRNNAWYWADWYEARLMVLTGKLDVANELYKKALEHGLYRAGKDQQQIIEEALVVAASKSSPDKSFLKHLKNANVFFKYDIPSIESSTPSNKITDTVEDWEIELWRKSFYSKFPTKGMFEEGKKLKIGNKIGPFILSQDINFKLDTKRPNKKFKFGAKSFPQIVWFSYNEDYQAVKSLLEAGVDVNKLSSSGESALIMALEALDATSEIKRSLDDSLFNLISTYPHKPKTLDNRSHKKRLLPIILAVKSGKLDVVQKVIDMGADVNRRGETDLQTPLNICMKMIAKQKNPTQYWLAQDNIPVTPELLDSFRRHNPGLAGMSLDSQKIFLQKLDSDPMFRKFYNEYIKSIRSSHEVNIELSELREIFSLLLDRGANVNAEHNSPVKGYTPLMLAAELDEDYLFNQMLNVGGDPRKTYICLNTRREVDCWRIAEYFNSSKVMSILKDIERFFPEKLKSEGLN